MIAIVDLGSGNLRSVANAIAAVGGVPVVCSDPAELEPARAVVLPGVGAFGPAADRLRRDGWIPALEREVRENGKPFLGICLGMQLLARGSTEFGEHEGLGWIDATVERLPRTDPGLRIPHVGWNDVRFSDPGRGLSEGLESEECFYFVHGYGIAPRRRPFEKGTTDHGAEFVACVESDNVWGSQFHPEKSQGAGLRILGNFVRRTQ